MAAAPPASPAEGLAGDGGDGGSGVPAVMAQVELALALLADVDVSGLPAREALLVARAAGRASAAGEGLGLVALARLAETYPTPEAGFVGRSPEELRRRDLVAEVRSAFGLTPRAAALKVDEAVAAVTDLPASTAALRAGSLDGRTAYRIRERTQHLSPQARRDVDERVMARHAAARDGLSARAWGELLGREVLAADPDGARARTAEAVRGRRVWADTRDGTAGQFGAHGPVGATAAAFAAVDAAARAARAAGVAGTLNELRFDTVMSALQGLAGTGPGRPSGPDVAGREAADSEAADSEAADSEAAEPATPAEPADPAEAAEPPAASEPAPGAPGAAGAAGAAGVVGSGVEVVLHVTMPISALAGCDDSPGVIEGHGPASADVCRDLAAAARVWWRILTDPVDGHVVTQAVRGYRPTPLMSRLVRARAGGVCASRGCTARAGLQLDHVVPHGRGGPTSADNLCPLCGRCHDQKTRGAWVHDLDPQTGELTQTTPLGLVYATRPLGPPGPTGRTATPLDPDRDLGPEWEDPADTAGWLRDPPDPDGAPDDPPDPWPAVQVQLARERADFVRTWLALSFDPATPVAADDLAQHAQAAEEAYDAPSEDDDLLWTARMSAA